ncbi:hypothetical protein C9374_009772 [Naegleria lovaniensis]|uniref:Antistasin-like domain-containing protein n=1 Tax=Naegleria lovaniensis TaxID=51637 RepID=A0AA88H1U6_NAELO|nr:uncharacterized protein C9374_009772 [Naegleria lovaniensis]KAG2393195.1 hypothetical protein C9374_009772 [Naegleria lovaniensis]
MVRSFNSSFACLLALLLAVTCLFLTSSTQGLSIAKPPGRPCPVFRCMRACEYGYKVNEYGCPTCTCLKQRKCPTFYCFVPCKHGYAKDKYGCQKGCTCNPPPVQKPCPVYKCLIACKYGYKRDRNTGCQTCSCNPEPIF